MSEPHDSTSLAPALPTMPPRYWFPAKKYGWGWGFPSTWEGWLAMTAYFALLFGAVLVLDPAVHLLPFVVYTAVLSAGLLAVCLRTGAPARWRWGDKDG